MLDRIRRWLAPPVFEGDEEKTRQARLLNTVLLTFLVPLLAYAFAAVALPNVVVAWAVVSVVIAMDVGALIALRRGQVLTGGILFCVGMWLFLSLACVFFGGTKSPGLYGYIIAVILAGLLVGGRGAYLMAGLSVVGQLGIYLAETQGLLPEPLGGNPPIANFLVAALFAIMTAILLRAATDSLSEALARARQAAGELQAERGQLEATVQARTQDLTRRTSFLETTAAVARDAAQQLDLDKLLARTVSVIAERFEVYHCGIFLLDPARQWAVLQAASSEGGQRMLARAHRLRVGAEGVVGYVTRHGEPRVVSDTGRDSFYFDNPDLPDTRSEVVLPLRARGELIGVLDVQSTEPRAFGEEDAAILQTLADQVAVAISNARLFEQAQQSIDAERRAYADASREGWIQTLRSRAELGFRYAEERVMRVAGNAGDDQADADMDAQVPSLAVPILHRGLALGTLEAHKRDGSEWTAAERALMQTLADQLSVALESARLYEESQRRAVRERMIGEVTAHMRESLDVEAVLRTATDELFQALGLEEVVIRLTEAE